MTNAEAIKEAQTVLKDEANELQCFLGTQVAIQIPHRAKVAIVREIMRLKQISDFLDPKYKPEDR